MISARIFLQTMITPGTRIAGAGRGAGLERGKATIVALLGTDDSLAGLYAYAILAT
jgi:hypothetical protein